MGQNASLALVLALWAIDALRRDRALEAGLACGLMMYKPTLALPLIGLLVLRVRWRELVVVAAVLVAAYFVGVAAAAGDWQWPLSWWNGSQPLLALDLAHNADKADQHSGRHRPIAGAGLVDPGPDRAPRSCCCRSAA